MTLSSDDVRAVLSVKIKASGLSQTQFAKQAGLSQTQLNDAVTGRRPPEPAILALLGLRRVVAYEPVAPPADTSTGEPPHGE